MIARVLLCLTLASGCTNREVARVEPAACAERVRDVPIAINRDLDILFVIDDSGSMGEEQISLATNFGRFVAVLESIEGGLPNLHLGVVSTNVGAGPYAISGCSGNGDDGMLQATPSSACEGPADAFIEDIAVPGGRQRNYTGSLTETFGCIAKLGVDGCGFEQPLESMKRALDGRNPGFLRPDAYLLVVIISDEDDCSAADPSLFDPANGALGPLSSFRCFEEGVECDPDAPRTPGPKNSCEPRTGSAYTAELQPYVDFLKTLKEDPSQVMVAGVFGDPSQVGVDLIEGEPNLGASCSSSVGEAAPPVRLAHFLQQFPQRNTQTSICNEDLSEALSLIAEQVTVLIGNCVDGELDQDPVTAGVQFDCQVSDVRFPGTDRQEEQILPECTQVPPPPGEQPCWYLEPAAAECPTTPTQLALRVERGGITVPVGTHLVARCLDSCQ